jgi:hypothetical protein
MKDLREWFEYHDGLISSRHNGLGDGNQLLLLVEDAKPRSLWLTTVELGCRTGREFNTSRLKMCDRNVEFRTVPHALLNDWKNIHPGKIRQQVFQLYQAVREFSGLLGFRKFLKKDGLLQREYTFQTSTR